MNNYPQGVIRYLKKTFQRRCMFKWHHLDRNSRMFLERINNPLCQFNVHRGIKNN